MAYLKFPSPIKEYCVQKSVNLQMSGNQNVRDTVFHFLCLQKMIASSTINQRLLRSALASKLAYIYKPTQTRKRPGSKHDIVQMHTPYIVAIRVNDHSTLVAFKGSTTLNDVSAFMRLRTAEFRFRDASVMVHEGILETFRSIHNQLDQIIPVNDILRSRPKKSITFAGHSQGGLLALFASAYFGTLSDGNMDITCHTFGAPRIGNQAFHDWQKQHTRETINIIHPYDVVPRIPIGFGYVSNPNTHVLSCQQSCHRASALSCRTDILCHHDMDTYLESMVNFPFSRGLS